MYLRHFGLREYPFSITPDTSFFFSSGASQEALNTLLVATRLGEGFIKITGEVGTGKTLLCRKLMASVGEQFYVVYLPNPYLDPMALFSEISSELGIEVPTIANQHSMLKAITTRLIELAQQGKRAIVCLDEAQAMPLETFEVLRLLTNIETEKRKLLQVIIFGQPELEEKLNHPAIRQLKQRITFHYHLGPLAGEELGYYLHHRLVVAGYAGGRLFEPLACWLMERKTRRVPRLVNIVAHKAMLRAFGRGRNSVGFFDVRAAALDTDSIDGVARARVPQFLIGIGAVGLLAAVAWMAMT